MDQKNQLHLHDLIYWLNQARQNPQSFIPYLEHHIQNFRNQFDLEYAPNCFIKTQEGRKAWNQAIDFLKLQRPLPALATHQGLTKSSQDHAIDLIKNDAMGSVGSDGSTLISRIKRYCSYESGIVGESSSYQFKKKVRNHSRQSVISLIVSDGLLNRDDRKSIFNSEFKYFGVSIEQNSYRYVTVINYSCENLCWLTENQISQENLNRPQNSNIKKSISLATNDSQNNSSYINSLQEKSYGKLNISENIQRISLH